MAEQSATFSDFKKRFCTTSALQNVLVGVLVFLALVFIAALLPIEFGTWLEGLLAKESLQFLGLAMGGILIALQALMSYKRATALEQTAIAQAKAVEKTGEGQRQDRFKNAIEHLGHKSDSVRLGEAYELFLFAQDLEDLEDSEDLSRTVLDILCAHVRHVTCESSYQAVHGESPSEEIQSILNLLLRRDVFSDIRIDLTGSWLKGAQLEEADLRDAKLNKTNLTKAKLDKATLHKAQLSDARMERASLVEAKMTKCCLQRANLNDASLANAVLDYSDLSEAELKGATLDEASLPKAQLYNARMQGASLVKANMIGCCLKQVSLIGASLENAVLVCSDLSKAELQGAFVGGVQLQGSILAEVKVEGATSSVEYKTSSFEDRIRGLIGKSADLSEVEFEGGLNQVKMESLIGGLSEEDRDGLQDIGKQKPTEHITKARGSYSAREAERFINEASGAD